jgi:hypothetical protein
MAFIVTLFFLFALWLYLSGGISNIRGLLLFFGLSALFIYGILATSRPDKTEEDIPDKKEISNLQKKPKKKIPKRRKDYH